MIIDLKTRESHNKHIKDKKVLLTNKLFLKFFAKNKKLMQEPLTWGLVELLWLLKSEKDVIFLVASGDPLMSTCFGL